MRGDAEFRQSASVGRRPASGAEKRQKRLVQTADTTQQPRTSKKMKFRKLGSSDLLVSEVCLGTMTWANQNTEAEAHAQIDRFIELGGNFIDTAELYPVPPGASVLACIVNMSDKIVIGFCGGFVVAFVVAADVKYMGKTEEFIGNWLEKHLDMRSKLVIATKARGSSEHSVRKSVTAIARILLAYLLAPFHVCQVAGPCPKSWHHSNVVTLRDKALGENVSPGPDGAPLARLVPDQIRRRADIITAHLSGRTLAQIVRVYPSRLLVGWRRRRNGRPAQEPNLTNE